MNRLHQNEIIKLTDKDLQLQYLLGGLNTERETICEANIFWHCDIRCSCPPVPNDERLSKIKEFIRKHNISNETFLRLTLNYLKGKFLKYMGTYGEFITELDRVLLDYKFIHSKSKRLLDNDFKEKELLELLETYEEVEGSLLNNFLKRYLLTSTDFMVLAKTSVNYNYLGIRGIKTKDLSEDLRKILSEFELYQSLEYVEEYHRQLEGKKESYELRIQELERLLKEERSKHRLSLFRH